MVYSTVDTVGGSVTGVTTLTPTVGDGTSGDVVFVHVVWTNPDITLGDTGDLGQVPNSLVTGPEYASVMLHHVLTGTDDLQIDWTGSSDATWQALVAGGLTGDPLDTEATAQSNSAALLPRLQGIASGAHVVCFAGCINLLSRAPTTATPDVGFMISEATQDTEVAGMPVLWCGQFAGALGDLDTTFPAAVYFDPPPTHSVGHSVSVNVA